MTVHQSPHLEVFFAHTPRQLYCAIIKPYKNFVLVIEHTFHDFRLKIQLNRKFLLQLLQSVITSDEKHIIPFSFVLILIQFQAAFFEL